MNTVLVAGIVAAVLVVGAVAGLWYFRRRQRQPRTFEGTFTFGWEVSCFIPGDASRKAPRYWVAWTPESRFMETFKEQGFDPAWTAGQGTVRTRFIGTLETNSKGGYGHMGQYEGQIVVTRVLEMTPAELKT